MRPRTGFDTTIFVLVGLCLVLNAIELFAPSPWWYHAMAAVGVLGILALYLTLYRPVLPSGSPRPWWALALLILSVGVACAGFTHMMPVQIAAHVLVWATVSTASRAVLASAAITGSAFTGVRLGELAGEATSPQRRPEASWSSPSSPPWGTGSGSATPNATPTNRRPW